MNPKPERNEQESDHEKEERTRWKAGMRELMETPQSREALYGILQDHGVWEEFTGLSDMTRDEAIGAHNAGVRVLSELRMVAPELVAMMVNEAAQREVTDDERSRRDDDDRDRSKRSRVDIGGNGNH